MNIKNTTEAKDAARKLAVLQVAKDDSKAEEAIELAQVKRKYADALKSKIDQYDEIREDLSEYVHSNEDSFVLATVKTKTIKGEFATYGLKTASPALSKPNLVSAIEACSKNPKLKKLLVKKVSLDYGAARRYLMDGGEIEGLGLTYEIGEQVLSFIPNTAAVRASAMSAQKVGV